MNAIFKEAWVSVRALSVFVVLCCGLYPLTVYAIGQTAFHFQANGSLVDKDGNPTTPENAAGSRLLGQSFSSAGYFHPRPSAAGAGYDAASSSGTNLGPISDKFLNGAVDDPKTKDVDESFAGIKQLVQTYREENGLGPDALVPGDAVTRSASGLDPQISPRNAGLQVLRVAKARGLAENRVRELVQQNTEGRGWGIFGEPGVNVLMLNIALDKITSHAPSENHVAQGN
jgi:potassium-transporting ATPase KdpC subunit